MCLKMQVILICYQVWRQDHVFQRSTRPSVALLVYYINTAMCAITFPFPHVSVGRFFFFLLQKIIYFVITQATENSEFQKYRIPKVPKDDFFKIFCARIFILFAQVIIYTNNLWAQNKKNRLRGLQGLLRRSKEETTSIMHIE